MKYICLYFQVHQPFRLDTFRFFDIGSKKHYWDNDKNRLIMRKIADKCYLPANKVLLDGIREYGRMFKVCFSISGVALDQFRMYAPEVLESFQELAATGSVEFLSETSAHSLSALASKDEFIRQVRSHTERIGELFDQRPKVFRNTELIYSDEIGTLIHEMGFKGMLAEGTERILNWRSPNFIYVNARTPELRLLLKNYRLSDDIAFRFSDRSWPSWPLTADKYVAWLNDMPLNEDLVNLFMDYETFGEHQWPETGIFEFLKAFPGELLRNSDYRFITPAEAISEIQPVASISMEQPVSWADEERDLSAWLGNNIQKDAFESLYRLEHKIRHCTDPEILSDWRYLQTSDHFYYMCTKYFSDGDVHKYFNPYNSPYEAFINYMNILSDFEGRINRHLQLAAPAMQTKHERQHRRLRHASI